MGLGRRCELDLHLLDAQHLELGEHRLRQCCPTTVVGVVPQPRQCIEIRSGIVRCESGTLHDPRRGLVMVEPAHRFRQSRRIAVAQEAVKGRLSIERDTGEGRRVWAARPVPALHRLADGV
ncbi:MAG: hypothetical protein U0667_17525 [Chloroflexota bacterium]